MQDSRFNNGEILALHLAEDLAERMRKTIAKQGKVAVALSGGRTPVQFFHTLAKQELDWGKVVFTLVDERWVDISSEASNERLIRTHLLQGKAAKAWLVPLKNAAKSALTGYMDCENRLFSEMPYLDYAVMGMGSDGHTASWFPHSAALPKVLSSESSAKCTPITDAEDVERMTLNWNFLAQCKHLYLHFEGDEKNQVFQQAMASEHRLDVAAMPVRHLLNQQQVPLSIYRTL